MATQLKLKKSSVIGKVPLAGDLEYGELALNYADGYLYYKDDSNDIQRFLDSDGIVSAARNSLSASGNLVYDPAAGIVSLDSDTNLYIKSIQFDTIDSAIPNGNPGHLLWNTDEATLDLGLENGSVLQIGQETVFHTVNQSGSTIPNGTLVMAVGAIGASGKISIAPAVTDGSVAPRFMLGIATHDIPNGETGYITTFGKVRNLDTSAYSEGSVLYNNPAVAGGLTDSAPSAPNLDFPVAFVLNSHANNGTIVVRFEKGFWLKELHDVSAVSPSDNQVLAWDSDANYWNSKTLQFTLQQVTDAGNTTSNSIFAPTYILDSANSISKITTGVSSVDGLRTVEITPPELVDPSKQTLLIKGGGPPPQEYHLHLVAKDPVETELFLGTDSNHWSVKGNNIYARAASDLTAVVDNYMYLEAGIQIELNGGDWQVDGVAQLRLDTGKASLFGETEATLGSSAGITYVFSEKSRSAILLGDFNGTQDSCINIISSEGGFGGALPLNDKSLWIKSGWLRLDSGMELNNLAVDNTESTLLLLDTNNKVVTTDITTLVDSDYVAARAPFALAETNENTPASPTNGYIWFDTSTGMLKVYYTDSDTSQWVVPVGSGSNTGTNHAHNYTYSVIPTNATTLTIDLTDTEFGMGAFYQFTLSGNITTFNITNVPTSVDTTNFILRIVQDTTARSITWPGSVLWEGGTAPTLSSGSGEIDLFSFFSTDGGTTWYGTTIGQNFS